MARPIARIAQSMCSPWTWVWRSTIASVLRPLMRWIVGRSTPAFTGAVMAVCRITCGVISFGSRASSGTTSPMFNEFTCEKIYFITIDGSGGHRLASGCRRGNALKNEFAGP